MTPFNNVEFNNHELVQFCMDSASGLMAIIAVHSTALGPAMGGCRMWNYNSADEALIDALRLSRGMTYKNAIAGIPFGGGKSVIIGSAEMKSADLFKGFGNFVQGLGGAYITAEDVGIRVDDMVQIATTTDFAAGLPVGTGGAGDPSPYTARGVFACASVAVERVFNQRSFKGLRVAVQGLGSVGRNLCNMYHEAGASLVVSDLDAGLVRNAVNNWGASVVAVEAIHAADVDIFSPCAMGGVLNPGTVGDIKASIVTGAANNQLLTDSINQELAARNILYVPDFVANAGGVIQIASEVVDNASPAWVEEKIAGLAQTTIEILKESEVSAKTPVEIAKLIAEQRIEAAHGQGFDPGRFTSRSRAAAFHR